MLDLLCKSCTQSLYLIARFHCVSRAITNKTQDTSRILYPGKYHVTGSGAKACHDAVQNRLMGHNTRTLELEAAAATGLCKLTLLRAAPSPPLAPWLLTAGTRKATPRAIRARPRRRRQPARTGARPPRRRGPQCARRAVVSGALAPEPLHGAPQRMRYWPPLSSAERDLQRDVCVS